MLSFLMKILFLYLALLLLMFIFQRSLLYYPQYGNYNVQSIPKNFKEIFIQTSDGLKIKGWLNKKDFINKKTVLYFHGNAGTINNRIYRLEEFAKMDVNFLIISYRGYSNNPGKPSEEGLYKDARSAIKFLNNLGVTNDNLFLYGESLGTGVVTEVAQRKEFAGVILEAPFTSTTDVAKKLYSIFPVSYLVKDRYDSLKKISNINSPVLILHGKNDNLIPVEMGKKLFDNANQPKYLFTTQDDHVIKFEKKTIGVIENFLNKKHI